MNRVHIICKNNYPYKAIAGIGHAEAECDRLVDEDKQRCSTWNGEGNPPKKVYYHIVTLSVSRREPSEYDFPSTQKLRGLFESAKIPFTAVEIPNQYWPESPDYDDVRSPWLRVFTQRGVIVMGWRKKVISIDWSDSMMEVHGSSVVYSPDITHWERGCHAWSYKEAESCLLRLWVRSIAMEDDDAQSS